MVLRPLNGDHNGVFARGLQEGRLSANVEFPAATRATNADWQMPSSPTGRLPLAARLALLCAVTLTAYLPALRGGLIWDDAAHITKPQLQSLDGLRRIWFDVGATQQYYPLLHSVFWIEHRLWGDRPFFYHLANLLLHSAAACLVYLVLRRLQIPCAYLAAALFALHPVQVESVAWITEQKNTLSAVFYLSAMLAYLRFDQAQKMSFYFLAFALFILGLLTKTVTATLPGALLVIFWWQRGRLSWKKDVQPAIPFFVIGAVAGLFTAWVERKLIGAEGNDFALSLADRLLLAGRVPWFYLGKLLCPLDLVFVYPRWNLDASDWRQWLFPVVSIVWLVALWLLRKCWRAPLAGWLFFVGTLFPVLGFFNVFPFMFSFVADHFQYLACLGVIVVVASGLTLAVQWLPPIIARRRFPCSIILCGIVAALTWRQCCIYEDADTLYRATLEQNPDCWFIYNNLGFDLASQGHLTEAADLYRHALALKPDYALAHYNLADIFFVEGHSEEAIAHYKQVLLTQPDSELTYNKLGIVYQQIGQLDKAIDCFRQAISINPFLADGHHNLGLALWNTGRREEAIDECKRSLEIAPDNDLMHVNLGTMLFETKQIQEAIEQFKEALRINPSNAEAKRYLEEAGI